MALKLIEQGHKSGNTTGTGSVIRGGDGQEIHPNLIKKLANDYVGIFEFVSATDSRLLSSVGRNGAYEIKAIRAGSEAKVTIEWHPFTGESKLICTSNLSALMLKEVNDIELPIKGLPNDLKLNLESATIIAVMRTYQEDTADHSLEARPPVDVLQQQLKARQNVGRAVHVKKETPHGRHRPHRMLTK